MENDVDTWTLKLIPNPRVFWGKQKVFVQMHELCTEIFITSLLGDGGVERLAHENHDEQRELPHVEHQSREFLVIRILCQNYVQY